VINRAKSQQWYINLPSALAHALQFTKSEVVEWEIERKDKLILRRKMSKKRRKKSIRRPIMQPGDTGETNKGD